MGGREQLSNSLQVTKMVKDRAEISSRVVSSPGFIPFTTSSQLLESTESEVAVLEVYTVTRHVLWVGTRAASYLLFFRPSRSARVPSWGSMGNRGPHRMTAVH